MKNKIEVNAATGMKAQQITVEVKIVGVWLLKVRLKIGAYLFRLAAFVLGCQVNVSMK